MDPTLLAILSIFGGAALTAGAGFFGAWVQSRREHKKWLREQRFKAYTQVDEIFAELTVHEIVRAMKREAALPDDSAEESLRRLTSDLPGPLARINLLGPKEVVEAKDAWLAASNGGQSSAEKAASDNFARAMRKALGIKMTG